MLVHTSAVTIADSVVNGQTTNRSHLDHTGPLSRMQKPCRPSYMSNSSVHEACKLLLPSLIAVRFVYMRNLSDISTGNSRPNRASSADPARAGTACHRKARMHAIRRAAHRQNSAQWHIDQLAFVQIHIASTSQRQICPLPLQTCL